MAYITLNHAIGPLTGDNGTEGQDDRGATKVGTAGTAGLDVSLSYNPATVKSRSVLKAAVQTLIRSAEGRSELTP